MNIVARAVRGLIPKAWLSPIGSWWPEVLESYAGAWQSNVTVDKQTVSAYWAVFACTTLIAKDISKLMAQVMEPSADEQIYEEVRDGSIVAVLKKPNHYQNRLEFMFTWLMSELLCGNTYILKARDSNRKVTGLYPLDPNRVVPLVSEDGAIYYQLNADNLSGIKISVTVPASEIIHDRMYAMHHPLIGVSPIYACGIAAMQGTAIQKNSAKFFQNMSRPSGMLVAPGSISTTTAATLKTQWETNFAGDNMGKIAVLGDGLKYESMSVNAHDAQLIEQLKMTGEMIAACYHVPGYKIGVGAAPSITNTSVLNQQYYDQCLQYLIEKIELRLEEGLEVSAPQQIWLDLSGLLRMDPDTRFKAHSESVKGGWKAPNEARKEENMRPLVGGDTAYMQQQNYSLEALSRRDAVDAASKTAEFSPAMDKDRLSSLQSIVTDVMSGKLPKESAKKLMAVAFPFLDATQINEIIDPIVPAEPEPEDPDDEELTEDDVRAYIRSGIAEMHHA